jgi:large subunit ribosomal protein L17
MRHKCNQSRLGKPSDLRVALVRGQVSSLFLHGHIDTTFARAKAVQRQAEKLITFAKRGDLSSVRECSKVLYGVPPLRALLRKVTPNLVDVASGYTQITKLKVRRGDGALVVRLAVRNYPETGIAS